ITLGHNVELGYFAQNQDEILDNTISVFETLDAIAVGEIRTKVRDILGAFFFSGEDVDKKVRVLSGGERNRLAMAKLMLQPYNLLILDEPTNHLDIQSKAVLKEALQKYDGTVILVSHDRDFLEGLTTHIYEVKQTQIKEVIGDLHTYLNNIQAEEIRSQKKEEIQTSKKNKEQNTYSIKKEQEREIRKIKTSISRIEQEIEHIEEQIHTLNTLFIEQAEQATAEHFQTHAELQEQLQIKTHTWENLVEKLTEIEL
ncbi:MAG: ATP-binding cassette domain-containing protein, partial [Bacteroidales bacterium]|nr:ATP-binding cassette domain-containing protein [Bacteroidales bacterium]